LGGGKYLRLLNLGYWIFRLSTVSSAVALAKAEGIAKVDVGYWIFSSAPQRLSGRKEKTFNAYLSAVALAKEERLTFNV
jgi:hypothetical protein